jgi:hypothetical protein
MSKQFVVPTDTPVAAETIAEAIIGISEGMKRLNNSGLASSDCRVGSCQLRRSEATD